MKEIELEHFLLNSKVEPKKLDQFTSNEENKPFPLRDIFFDLSQTAEDYFTHKSSARMLALTGLRGIGKTTLMWQLAKKIYENYTQEIYFFNIEAFVQLFGDTKLYLIFHKFEEIVLKKRFYELEKPIVFLFDEVHDAENWSKGLKILYDECPRAFIIATGSSALLLHKNPDLAARWHIFRVLPFKFSEFIQAKSWKKWLLHNFWISMLDPGNNYNSVRTDFVHKDLEEDLERVLFFSENISQLCKGIDILKPKVSLFLSKVKENFIDDPAEKNLLLDYINYYNIPRFFSINNIEKIFEQPTEMFEKILRMDVPKWLESDKIDDIFIKAKKLLIRLAFSGEVQIESLARDLGCNHTQANLLIDVLTKAEVLNQFLSFGRINSKLNKKSKVFFMSPTLRLALREKYERAEIKPIVQAILYEEIVAMHLKRLFSEGQLSCVFSSEKDQKSPDFVIETLDAPIILEVKTSKKMKTDQVVKSGIDCRYGIVVSAEAEDYAVSNNTIVIPLSWFLLL